MNWTIFLLIGITLPISAMAQDCTPASHLDIITISFQQPQGIMYEAPNSIIVADGAPLLLDTLVDVSGVDEYIISWKAKVDGQLSLIPNISALREDVVLIFSITNPTGCTLEDSLQVTVENVVSTQEVYGGLDFDIYPNPSSSELFLSMGHTPGPVNISVFDVLGKKVLRQKEQCFSGQCIYQLNINGWKPGLYIVHLRAKNHLGTQLIFINK